MPRPEMAMPENLGPEVKLTAEDLPDLTCDLLGADLFDIAAGHCSSGGGSGGNNGSCAGGTGGCNTGSCGGGGTGGGTGRG
jgi:hypothetical protein